MKLHLMNRALLSKWCWRYGSEVNALWRKLMIEKFGYITRWTPNISRITQGVGCWRRIITLFQSFSQDLVFEVNSGKDTRFWHDNWLDGGTLALTSPQLFLLSKQKRSNIHAMTSIIDGQTVWNFKFSRELNALESSDLDILLAIIGSPPDSDEPNQDNCRWRIAPTTTFSVKAHYGKHCALSITAAYDDFPVNFIWRTPVPARVKFFVWTACLNKCLTIDNLNKRGRFIVSRCPLCKASLETLDHILLHCTFAAIVWNAFMPLLGFAWCMPSNPMELALCWRPIDSWSKRAKVLWRILPIAIWWGLWLKRNARTFQREESSPVQVIGNVRGLIFSWSLIIPVCKGLSLRDVALNWSNCITLL